MLFSTKYRSPIGSLLMACEGDSLIGLWFEGQKHFGGSVAGELSADDDRPVFMAAKKWLDAYFDGRRPPLSGLSLAPKGSAFRKAVWDILREIPYGSVIAYGEIARIAAARAGRAGMSSQAIGGAVGHNPLSIVIPCHRVVGADGSLTGYAGGLEKKKKLLEHEGVDMSRLFVPARGTAL